MSKFWPTISISIRLRGYFVQASQAGGRFLSVVRSLEVVRISEVENVLLLWGHVVCLLYGGRLFLGGSVM